MKVNNWWVKKGLLTSGVDPAPELSVAARQFPDDYTPAVFMVGDGHRHPPFEWSNRGVWAGFFDGLVRDNKVCCHVETFADAVTIDAVPKHLEAVFINRKVFGWEPEFYKVVMSSIDRAMTLQLAMTEDAPLKMSEINALAHEINVVADLGYLGPEAELARAFAFKASQYMLAAKDLKAAEIPTAKMGGFLPFLNEYKNTAMSLRCVINNVIGANIQRVINTYPDHMHLIACGDAHILVNPLQLYIQPPTGTFGVADAGRA
jgi:hypothetical protein